METNTQKPLAGKVAVVTGASRGVGRGVAAVLGERGATVYVTGRTVAGNGTIHETASLVSERGGKGIAVQVDHANDDQTEELFKQVGRDQGRLDILVNNVWSGYANMENYQAPIWEQPIWRWDLMFDIGARAFFVASKFAIPLMLTNPGGLIVNTGYPDTEEPRRDGSRRDWVMISNIAKDAVNDLTRVLAWWLREYRTAAVTVAPAGHVINLEATARVYEALRKPGGIEALYRTNPPGGETSEYSGRAVAALATDPDVMTRSGSVLVVDELAEAYGFTDIDGRRPALC
ncbi:MAG TPA: SDR family NAD(P)-dependent oxidoreductase, partial [Capsulimonadaceae bacterium]|nr:SDR family NAD(P)-dependent oxidoreductase [Capsulimonadaceae bacterium]